MLPQTPHVGKVYCQFSVSTWDWWRDRTGRRQGRGRTEHCKAGGGWADYIPGDGGERKEGLGHDSYLIPVFPFL